MSIRTLANNLAEASARGGRVALTYLRLKLKHHLLVNALRLRARRERFLGYTVPLIDYRLFVYLFEEIFVRQDYHVAAVEDGATIVDGGSNIGMSVLFFKWLYPGARICAFEPGTHTFACLRELVEVNGLTDVELHNSALTDHTGPVTFYSDPDQPGSLRMSMVKSRLPKSEGTVMGVRLSDWITGPIDLLKLDVEGAEGPVIAELANAGKLTSIQNMVIEYHHHIGPDTDCLSDILRCFEQNGFGYQLRAKLGTPLRAGVVQDVLIYAYRNTPGYPGAPGTMLLPGALD